MIEEIRSLEGSENQVSTTIVDAYELLKGASIPSKSEENLMQVRGAISNLHVLELSLGACEEASKIYKELKERAV